MGMIICKLGNTQAWRNHVYEYTKINENMHTKDPLIHGLFAMHFHRESRIPQECAGNVKPATTSYIYEVYWKHYQLTTNYMMYGYYGDYYPFHIFGSIFMILFWVVLLAILFRFLMRVRGQWDGRHDKSHPGADPVKILKERYAKGEITKEQFESMRKDIE